MFIEISDTSCAIDVDALASSSAADDTLSTPIPVASVSLDTTPLADTRPLDVLLRVSTILSKAS